MVHLRPSSSLPVREDDVSNRTDSGTYYLFPKRHGRGHSQRRLVTPT